MEEEKACPSRIGDRSYRHIAIKGIVPKGRHTVVGVTKYG